MEYRIKEIKRYVYIGNKRKKLKYYQIQELKHFYGKDKWLPFGLSIGKTLKRVEFYDENNAKEFLKEL